MDQNAKFRAQVREVKEDMFQQSMTNMNQQMKEREERKK